MKKLTIFSWGFWGWGNHADRFVKLADMVEASRGFKPPIFVDVRIRRTGRAVNFKQNAFRDIVGEKRYLWMQKLGNQAIIDTHLKNITIRDPREANTLLDFAIESMKYKRRIIYYCACEVPGNPRYDRHRCHRYDVGNLLLKEAKKRGIKLEVVEWPGGKAKHIKIKTSEDVIKKISNEKRFIPLSKTTAFKKYGGLPYGSIVEFISKSSNSKKIKIIDTIKYVDNVWVLPIWLWPPEDYTLVELKVTASKYLKICGYLPRVS